MEEDERRTGSSSDTHIFQEVGILLVCNIYYLKEAKKCKDKINTVHTKAGRNRVNHPYTLLMR
jgi:hypothetical protein